MAQLDEALFDRIAAAELKDIEKKLGDVDPDVLEIDFSLDVLTLTTADGGKVVINSHRAARQIWMAAFRKAWHFSPVEDTAGQWTWRTPTEELHATLRSVLKERAKLDVAL